MGYNTQLSGDDALHLDLTEKIIKCFYTVYNDLGYGFLEKVYEKAICIELQAMGLHPKTQERINVHYKGVMIGEYFADIIVNNVVIIELKASESLSKDHEYQLVNYLRATDIEVGLLLNFGKAPEVRRKSFRNQRKSH